MKVLFVYPVPPPRFQILRYQQGIGSISALLKRDGHSTSFLYIWELGDAALDQRIRRFQPDLVALSLTSGFFELGCAVAREIKDRHGLPVLLGGIHPTLCPEEAIAADGVFAICRGEGEYPTRELCAALESGDDPTGIPNLWIRLNGTVYRNEPRDLIRDLDSLPFPDREIVPYPELLNTLPEMEFMASRGCPFPCAYCVNHALMELYRGKGPYVRYRSVDNLLAEIGEVTERYGREWVIGFHDDSFTLNRDWLKEFSEKYSARFSIPFWCNSTADRIDAETVNLLKAAGCYEVRIGIESGNDRIRIKTLRKNVSRDQIVRAFRLLRRAGILTYSFNMVGLPGEGPAEIEETIRLNRDARPDEVFCSVFYPFPGTELRRLCLEKGWYTNRQVRSYFENEYALEQPTISGHQVIYYHNIFPDLVKWPWADRIIRLLGRIPVSRTKTLWNAFRRLRAKTREFRKYLAARLRKPSREEADGGRRFIPPPPRPAENGPGTGGQETSG